MKKLIDQLEEILEVDSLDLNSNLRDFELWDSLSALTLIAFVQDEFKIELEASELLEFATIQDLIDRISSSAN